MRRRTQHVNRRRTFHSIRCNLRSVCPPVRRYAVRPERFLRDTTRTRANISPALRQRTLHTQSCHRRFGAPALTHGNYAAAKHATPGKAGQHYSAAVLLCMCVGVRVWGPEQTHTDTITANRQQRQHHPSECRHTIFGCGCSSSQRQQQQRSLSRRRRHTTHTQHVGRACHFIKV